MSSEKYNIDNMDIELFEDISQDVVNIFSKNKKTFSTSYDCQRNIDILVYEGNDEEDCSNNCLIGSYKIICIPPLPKGKILIKLLFKITYNGLLNISIIGFKNPFDDNSNSFDYKFNNNIRLISSYMAKDLLKKLLSLKK